MEEAMETQINYMWDEYELTLSDAASLRKEELTDLGSMKKKFPPSRTRLKSWVTSMSTPLRTTRT